MRYFSGVARETRSLFAHAVRWPLIVIIVGTVFLTVGLPYGIHRGQLSASEVARIAEQFAAERAAAAASEAAETAKVDALFFGDSITSGTGRADDSDPRAADVAAKALGWEATVLGYPGMGYLNDAETGLSFPDQFRLDVANGQYDVIVIEGSSNDAAIEAPADDLAAAVEQVIETARQVQPDTAVVLLGPYSTITNGFWEQRDVLSAKAAEHELPFIDPVERGWMVEDPQYISSDGYHPNSAGHAYLGERWAEALRQELLLEWSAPPRGSPLP